MIDALIQGKLLKDPEARQTKAGKPYATARVRVPTTNPAETLFASVVAFDPEAVAALLALGEGDSVRKARAAGGGGGHTQARNGSTDKPTHAAWQARQVNRPADFAGFDDLGF